MNYNPRTLRTRISKGHYYRNGGMSNPLQFRRMRDGAWTYWLLG